MGDNYEGDLAARTGELKRAAIDAYMADQGWVLEGGEKYHLGDCDVTRPGADGTGGGDWDLNGFWDIGNSGQDAKWKQRFDEVRTRIDQALVDWQKLPDPEKVHDVVEKMRLLNGRLSVGAVTSKGTVTGGGQIGGNLNLAMENSDAMAGGLITAFKANFMSQLGRAIGGHHAITVIMGGALAAQEEMWRGARTSVIDIVEGARDVCRKIADDGGADWAVALKVAGYAVAGASIFASGGAATALAVGSLGLSILDEAVPDPSSATDAPGDDYESVMDAFTKALSQLDEQITTEEQKLQSNFTTNMKQIRAQQGAYDLTEPTQIINIDDDSDLGEIKVDEVLALEITGTYLPNVATELLGAKSDAWGVVDLSSLSRNAGIGIGYAGPSAEFHDMRWLLQELLGNLGTETQYAAKALDLGIRDIKVTDSSAMDALERHHRDLVPLGANGANDPWNE